MSLNSYHGDVLKCLVFSDQQTKSQNILIISIVYCHRKHLFSFGEQSTHRFSSIRHIFQTCACESRMSIKCLLSSIRDSSGYLVFGKVPLRGFSIEYLISAVSVHRYLKPNDLSDFYLSNRRSGLHLSQLETVLRKNQISLWFQQSNVCVPHASVGWLDPGGQTSLISLDRIIRKEIRRRSALQLICWFD